MEIRDATPNVGGSQVDPSVATTASGGRLLAATDAGTSTVRVWKPSGPPNNTTWSNAAVPGAARQAAIAWDGGATAQLATASSTGCGAPAAIKVRSYTVAGETYGAATTLGLFAAPDTATQTWPRLVLGDPGDADHAGDPITVADEEDCTTGGHQVVVAWPGSLTRPVAPGRYPDVAVLGPYDADGPGPNPPNGTVILTAYLVDVSAGAQELQTRQCTVVGTFTLTCGASATVRDFATPGPVTVGTTTVDALAAPSLSCDAVAGICHVAWTESFTEPVSGAQRTRVFVSSTAGPGYASWSPARQVASSSTSSQLLPSVSAHGSRADVVYVDTRPSPSKVDAFQTSLDGSARGVDVSLTNGVGYDPAAGASLGQRTAIAGFGASGTSGVVRGYFPDASSDLGAVSEAELAHGTTPVTLPAAGIAPAVPKNTSYNASNWLAFADPDGDPVTVTVDDPAHGSFASGLYSPDPSYAGSDTVRVRATTTDGSSSVISDHVVSVTNQAPILDAPAPAIVDEGGAVVTVPLHAVDPDLNDAIVYSIALAPPLLAAPRATVVGSSLRLDIPAGVRSMAPLRITLRARDTTTGSAPGQDTQDLSVTIRPDLRTPSTILNLSDIHITGARTTITARTPAWDDPSSACLASTTQGCHVRRVWNFGDGSRSVTTTDQPTISHDYPRAGTYTGQLTTWVLWGSSQVAAPPKSFPIKIADDGRVLVAVKPSVRRVSATVRLVTIRVTARANGKATIYLNVAGRKIKPRPLILRANGTTTIRFRVSIRNLKSRRATIRISGWGMLASTAPPPTDVYRPVILR